MDFKQWLIIVFIALWCGGIFCETVVIRKELTEIKLILKYCEFDDVSYEDYVPPSESLT